jgi:hypothetical protein
LEVGSKGSKPEATTTAQISSSTISSPRS